MWPLYDDPQEVEGVRIEAEGVAKRWDDDVERSYFEDFRSDWRRIHDVALRAVPMEDGKESARWKAAMKKIEDVAMVMREHATTAEDSMEMTTDTKLPSFWDAYSIHEASCEDENNEKRVERQVSLREVGPCCRTRSVDGVVLVDRLDREDIQTALCRLQDSGAQLVAKIAKRSMDPPECPFLTLEMVHHPTLLKLDRDKAEPSVEQLSIPAPKWQVSVALRMVDRPYLRRTSMPVSAWSKLEQQAQRVLSTVINDSEDLITHVESTSKPELHVVRELLSGFREGESKETTAIQHGEGTEGSSATQAAIQQLRDTPAQVFPRPIKFDGLFKPREAQISLDQLALSTRKGIVKKNASLLLASTVPTTLTSDVGDLLRRAKRATMSFEHVQGASHDGLRMVPLPSELQSHDDFRVTQACATMGALASCVLKSVQAPTISLTNLALTLASLWRESGVLAHVDTQSSASFAFSPFHEEPQIPSCHPANEDTRNELVAECVHEPSALTKGVSDSIDGGLQIEHIAEDVFPDTTVSTTIDLPVFSPSKEQVTFKFLENASTDELVTSFLGGEPDHDTAQALTKVSVDTSTGTQPPDSLFAASIDRLARPAVWFLVRVKLLKIKPTAMVEALKAIPVEVFASVVFQLQSKLKGMVSHAGTIPQDEILESCSAFRHAVWLHSLRLLVEFEDSSSCSRLLVASRILVSRTYRSALGKTQYTALSNLHKSMGGSPVAEIRDEQEDDVGCHASEQPPQKKPKAAVVQQESMPVRLLCSMHLLERDELLEELSELGVSVIERELPPSIDLIVDEHNAIVLVNDQQIEEEKLMKVLTYELAMAQVQFRKLWVLLGAHENEDTLHLFFAALINFKIEVQTFACFDDVEASQVIRGIVDACAEEALSRWRILPRMWFARPFMLEEESQLERFLSSTRIMNAFAAQSVLHRLTFEELTSKSQEELKAMIGASLTSDQLTLLWTMLHSRHGIDNGEQLRS